MTQTQTKLFEFFESVETRHGLVRCQVSTIAIDADGHLENFANSREMRDDVIGEIMRLESDACSFSLSIENPCRLVYSHSVNFPPPTRLYMTIVTMVP